MTASPPETGRAAEPLRLSGDGQELSSFHAQAQAEGEGNCRQSQAGDCPQAHDAEINGHAHRIRRQSIDGSRMPELVCSDSHRVNLLDRHACSTSAVDTNSPGRNVKQITVPAEFFGWVRE